MRIAVYSIGGAAAVIWGLVAWKNRAFLKNQYIVNANKAKGVARSTWKSVDAAAKNLMHTEREPQPVA